MINFMLTAFKNVVTFEEQKVASATKCRSHVGRSVRKVLQTLRPVLVGTTDFV